MVVYIEYAFLWNLLLDGALLRLSLYAVKRRVKFGRLLLASLLGSGFAVLFPLLSLPVFLRNVLKFSVGALLCLIAFGKLKRKKEWGKYALSIALFFAFTFAFGGAVLGVSGENTKKGAILLALGVFTVGALVLIKKLYKRRAVERFTYPCKVSLGEKKQSVFGFYDSGNLAVHKGLPVCFLSPEIFYDIFGEEIAFGGATYEKISLSTVSGTKRATACLGEVEIELKKGETMIKQVYFSPSPNMVLREYPLLLNSRIFEELSNINKRVGERL